MPTNPNIYLMASVLVGSIPRRHVETSGKIEQLNYYLIFSDALDVYFKKIIVRKSSQYISKRSNWLSNPDVFIGTSELFAYIDAHLYALGMVGHFRRDSRHRKTFDFL